jgi:hypothetical protein
MQMSPRPPAKKQGRRVSPDKRICRTVPRPGLFPGFWRQFYFIFTLAEIMHNKTVVSGALETPLRGGEKKEEVADRKHFDNADKSRKRILPQSTTAAVADEADQRR